MCGIIKFFSAMSDGFIHENSYADDINSISCNISKYQNIEYHPNDLQYSFMFLKLFLEYYVMIDFNF